MCVYNILKSNGTVLLSQTLSTQGASNNIKLRNRIMLYTSRSFCGSYSRKAYHLARRLQCSLRKQYCEGAHVGAQRKRAVRDGARRCARPVSNQPGPVCGHPPLGVLRCRCGEGFSAGDPGVFRVAGTASKLHYGAELAVGSALLIDNEPLVVTANRGHGPRGSSASRLLIRLCCCCRRSR